jgi:hypothetical protein
MTIATKHVSVTATAPTRQGTFEGRVFFNPPQGDHDNERISGFTNLPGVVDLRYMHQIGDPGAKIGTATVMVEDDGDHLLVLGKLDVNANNPMADAVFERMLLPSTDPNVLKELSVGFDYNASEAYIDNKGVRVIPNAKLLELSIVFRGSQPTSISGVKQDKSALGSITQVSDRRQVRCTGCGQYQAVTVHKAPSPGSIYVGITPCCQILYGWSPASWSKARHVAYMTAVRAALSKAYRAQALKRQQVWTLVKAMADAGAPAEMMRPALSSAVECVRDTDYAVQELVDRLRGIVDLFEGDDPEPKSIRHRNLAAALDALEAEVSVSEKGQKHRLLSTMNSAGVIIKLRDEVQCRVNGEVITGQVVDIGESGVLVAVGSERYLVNADNVLSSNSDLSNAVDALIADVRREKAAERVEAKRLEEAALYMHANTTEEDRVERERERREREDAERERIAAERAADRERAAIADEVRRSGTWHRVGGADVK